MGRVGHHRLVAGRLLVPSPFGPPIFGGPKFFRRHGHPPPRSSEQTLPFRPFRLSHRNLDKKVGRRIRLPTFCATSSYLSRNQKITRTRACTHGPRILIQRIILNLKHLICFFDMTISLMWAAFTLGPPIPRNRRQVPVPYSLHFFPPQLPMGYPFFFRNYHSPSGSVPPARFRKCFRAIKTATSPTVPQEVRSFSEDMGTLPREAPNRPSRRGRSVRLLPLRSTRLPALSLLGAHSELRPRLMVATEAGFVPHRFRRGRSTALGAAPNAIVLGSLQSSASAPSGHRDIRLPLTCGNVIPSRAPG
jgi:hypothetical protein